MEAGSVTKFTRSVYVFHFWRCLVFLSSLAYVYQSRMRCNKRNGNFIMAACERGGCSMGRRLLGGGRDMQTRNGASSSQTTSKGSNGWGVEEEEYFSGTQPLVCSKSMAIQTS